MCVCVCACVHVCVCVNPASLKISLWLWNPCQCSGLRHSDLLGKAATLKNGIYPERSHCLTVNARFIFSLSCVQQSPSFPSVRSYRSGQQPERHIDCMILFVSFQKHRTPQVDWTIWRFGQNLDATERGQGCVYQKQNKQKKRRQPKVPKKVHRMATWGWLENRVNPALLQKWTCLQSGTKNNCFGLFGQLHQDLKLCIIKGMAAVRGSTTAPPLVPILGLSGSQVESEPFSWASRIVCVFKAMADRGA